MADDLTGAMDTGVHFAQADLSTTIWLSDEAVPPAEVVVLTTDSRGLSGEEAYARSKEAAERLGGRHLFKKLDGTMRGNVGQEVDGMLDGLGWQRALV